MQSLPIAPLERQIMSPKVEIEFNFIPNIHCVFVPESMSHKTARPSKFVNENIIGQTNS
jgi:hypothetical protein